MRKKQSKRSFYFLSSDFGGKKGNKKQSDMCVGFLCGCVAMNVTAFQLYGHLWLLIIITIKVMEHYEEKL